jgi:general secretion pathway protein J
MKKNTGFTLVEVLIALFIFAIIASLMLTGLHAVLRSKKALDTHYAQLAELQLALTLMQRDFTQIVPRPITNSSGVLEPPLLGTVAVVNFTRAGVSNPLAVENRSTLQRITYQIQNGQLIRISAGQLDQLPNTGKSQRILLQHISQAQFAYLDQNNQPREQWPLIVNDMNLPRAIQVILTIPQLGSISRLFVIPGGVDAKQP